jgi:RNA methyltransferase, TrmH family
MHSIDIKNILILFIKMISKQQLKQIQSLKIKKYRQSYNEFVIEGEKLIREALQESMPVKYILATHAWMQSSTDVFFKHVEVFEISDKQMQQVSSLSTAPQVLAIVGRPANNDFDTADITNWCIALDGINDPGNLGTILRSADWFGIKIIFCSDDCVDSYNPKAIQASMGSLFRVQVYYVNLYDTLKSISLKKYAAVLSGKNIMNEALEEKGIIVIGNESHGISSAVLSVCDEHITIPGQGNAESLNAAVACSIILSHLPLQ